MNSARDQQTMALSERAAYWHQLYEDGNPTPAQDRKYLRWLKASPRHVAEALRIGLLDLRLRRTARYKESIRTREQKIIAFPQAAVRRAEVEMSHSEPPRRAQVRRLVMKVAACAFAAVLMMTLVRVASLDQAVVTARGEWLKTLLDDGSLAHVAPSSQLHVRFSKEQRSLVLVRGEALFDVAKDPSRPFVVSTQLGTVTAVGTHFGISHREDQVLVTVSEGEVAVRPAQPGQADHPRQRPIALKANQQLVLSRTSPPRLIDPVDAARELKWLQDWVEADGDTVAQMIQELNRRNEVQIVVEDPVVRNFRITSLGFKPNQPEVLVERANAWYAGYPGRKGDVALRLERP